MDGENKIVLCEREAMVAFNLYLDKMLKPEARAKVQLDGIEYSRTYGPAQYTLSLSEPDEDEPETKE